MKTFVISLKRSPDRRKKIKKIFQNTKMNFEFFDAVDGRELSQNYVDSVFDKETAEKTWKPMNRGEIGNALSHIAIYEKMIAENIESAVIFEDDVIFEPELKGMIENHKQFLPNDWDICLLGYGNIAKHKWQKLSETSNSNYKYGNIYGLASGSYAYMINLKGANKILNTTKPIIKVNDDLIGDALYSKTKLYGIFPPIVNHQDEINSTIDYEGDRQFNGHFISGEVRFIAINMGWSEKFAVFVDKILRFITFK